MTNVRSTMRGLFLAAFVLLPLAASAQDIRPDRGERLQRALDLSNAQVGLVQDAVGEEAEAGDLWRVAAALTPTLTDEQKEKLFARPERQTRPARRGQTERRVPREQRQARPDRTPNERPDPQARTEASAERREAMKADMRAALDLTDAQVRQLEALHADRKAEREALREELRDADRATRREAMQARRAERPAPGKVPAEVAAILTPAQQEAFAVHQALAVRMAGGRAHHGRAHH